MNIDRTLVEKLIIELDKDLNYSAKFDEVFNKRQISVIDTNDDLNTWLPQFSDFILVELLESIT